MPPDWSINTVKIPESFCFSCHDIIVYSKIIDEEQTQTCADEIHMH